MNIPDATAERGLLSYMEARCKVSSQHKLPYIEDILSTEIAGFIGPARTAQIIEKLLDEGRLVSYDGALSDHEIDVL